MACCADSGLSNDTKPKHFDRFVCLSINTFADITFPNGKKLDAKSVSVNSCGKWYMNKLHPSGPFGYTEIHQLIYNFLLT